eukprot:TRINITY_DN3015_c1_g1_i2.p1 TRINITY_DN3015_c1_g1~~TRINITY_DN3015_c1_g1_i2.p1  ORF type:complete len:323 (+),score=22.83 TRINITY_DN3015_c1_g1_i2:46-1014(+)
MQHTTSLRVIDQNGSLYTLPETFLKMTMGAVKKNLEKYTMTHKENMQLLYNGTALADNTTCQEIGFATGTHLHLQRRDERGPHMNPHKPAIGIPSSRVPQQTGRQNPSYPQEMGSFSNQGSTSRQNPSYPQEMGSFGISQQNLSSSQETNFFSGARMSAHPLRVHDHNGSVYTLSAGSLKLTVGEIKKILEKHALLERQHIRLLYKGRELSNTSTCRDIRFFAATDHLELSRVTPMTDLRVLSTHDNREFSVRVKCGSPAGVKVASLKQALAHQTGIPAEEQWLTHQGRELHETCAGVTAPLHLTRIPSVIDHQEPALITFL